MFSVTPSPLPPSSTPYDSSKHYHVQTSSTNNSKTETDIDAISTATAMFWGIPSPAALESTASDFRKQRQMQTSGFGYCFYFRFVPDSVLRSRILSKPVKWIGRALKHCCSRWEHLDVVFCRKVITTFGIRPPSCKFWMKVASFEIGIYTSEKLAPKT